MPFSVFTAPRASYALQLWPFINSVMILFFMPFPPAKKYDNDKVADIMGSHVMVFGLCLSAIAGINYVLKNRYPYIITITIIVMAVATEFGAYYRICKYAKLED